MVARRSLCHPKRNGGFHYDNFQWGVWLEICDDQVNAAVFFAMLGLVLLDPIIDYDALLHATHQKQTISHIGHAFTPRVTYNVNAVRYHYNRT